MNILLELVCDAIELIEKNVNILHNLKKPYLAITQSLFSYIQCNNGEIPCLEPDITIAHTPQFEHNPYIHTHTPIYTYIYLYVKKETSKAKS